MNITVDRKVIEQAVEALDYVMRHGPAVQKAKDLLRTALEQPQSVQVSPLDFTHAVRGKEDAVGRPIFWAEWPNREKA